MAGAGSRENGRRRIVYGSPCKELSCKEKERNRAVARRVSRLKTWFKKMGVSGVLLGEIQKIERITC